MVVGNPLKAWLISRNIKPKAFAGAISTPTQTVYKYLQPLDSEHFRMPPPPQMRRFYVETGGEVSPNDWYDLPDLADLAPDAVNEEAA